MNDRSINKYRIKMVYIMMFLLLPLTLPDYLQRIDSLENIAVFIVLLLFFTTLLLTVIKKKFNIFIFATFIYIIWRSFTSYYFSEGVLDLVNSFRILTLVLLINLSIQKYTKSTISALSSLFSIYIIINFITLLMYPNGLYIAERSSIGTSQGWFLGVSNQFAYVLLPGVIFSVLNAKYKNVKLAFMPYFIITIATLSLINVWSATSIVSMFFIIIMSFLFLNNYTKKIINFNMLMLFYIITFLLVIRIDKIKLFQFIVVDLLNKDLTLSTRTIIWDKVLTIIPEKLWIGSGVNTYVLAGKVTEFAAHNMILQITLDSGIIGLLMFMTCMLIAGFQLQKSQNIIMKNVLLIGIFAILIGGLAESYRVAYLFILLTLAFNINNFTRPCLCSRKEVASE